MLKSKIPQFDKELDEILKQLKPHKKICQQCQNKFEVLKEDIEFYKILRIPPPKLCPDCRRQRRYGFYNNILKFYKKECVAHKDEKAISTFNPKSLYKIFDLKYWWSDRWGAEEYTQDYNFSKSFFKQFQKFNQLVPHPAILNYYQNIVNSPYTISTYDVKNCYATALGGWSENSNYCYWVVFSNDCFDLLDSESCENCYEAVGCSKCYKCSFCEESENCVDCSFIYGCYSCQNCFVCTNLIHKKYHIFNKPYTKEEYLAKIKEINLGDRNVLEYYKKKFEKLLKETIRENLDNDPKNINCLGDKLYQAKDCYQVFLTINGTKKSENIRYSTDVGEVKDSMDLYIVGPNVSLSYELVEAAESSNIKFSYFISNSLNLEYCLNCRNCQDCFGCISLHNKKYHIFNKPYSKEEYYQLLDNIKIKMLQDGEYGEFFPLSQSLHSYNNTYAMLVFPLTKEQVLKNGWQWYDEPKIPIDLKGLGLIQIKDLPKDIKDVKDDILNKAILCEATNKPFRLIESELKFYREHNLPIPTKHPYQRMIDRFKKRNPTKLWEDTCDKCGQKMFTSYPPRKQKKLKIYCHKCYIKEVW